MFNVLVRERRAKGRVCTTLACGVCGGTLYSFLREEKEMTEEESKAHKAWLDTLCLLKAQTHICPKIEEV